jgi:hypothetical protein
VSELSKVDELIKLNLEEVSLLDQLNRVRAQRTALVRSMAGRGQHPAGVMWAAPVAPHQLPANVEVQKRASGSYPVINPPDHVDMRRRPQEEQWSAEEREMTQRAVAAAAGHGTIAWNPLATELAMQRPVPCPNEAFHCDDPYAPMTEYPCKEIGDHVHTADGGVHAR